MFFCFFFKLQDNENPFTVPKLSTEVDLRTQATLFALAERITAGESLVFFNSVLLGVKDKLEKLTPPNKKPFLSQFYSQSIDIIPELRAFVYQCAARKLVDVSSYDFFGLVVFRFFEFHFFFLFLFFPLGAVSSIKWQWPC